MKLRDYFFGQSVTLKSPLKPADVIRRVNGAAKSSWWPFNLGVIGGVRFGRLHLRYASSHFEYNAKPFLVGRIDGVIPGSILRLTYRGPMWSLPFDLCWYGILTTIAVTLVTSGFDPPATKSDVLSATAILIALFVVPAIMHLVGTRRADEELTELLAFLADTIEAKPVQEFAVR